MPKQQSSKRQKIDDQEPKVKITYNIDIVCTADTEKIFMNDYSKFNLSFNDTIKKVVSEKLYLKNKIQNSNELKDRDELQDRDEQDIFEEKFPNIGDRVRTRYTPASQKYIDHYDSLSFEGEVFFVDVTNRNFFMLNVEVGPLQDNQIDVTYRVRSLSQLGCHYFGISDAYYSDFSIISN